MDLYRILKILLTILSLLSFYTIVQDKLTVYNMYRKFVLMNQG